MTTASSTLRGTAQASSAANTAPVHEFRCLYTHDLRRKQKRWQDGFLRFHTFNKRVMVYDQPRNYIGDTHWKDGGTLNDGDELTLENGVIVQVAEPVATTQTDLTPILQKKPKDTPERSVPGSVRLPIPSARSAGLTASVAPRHRPLSQLLGTPRGPHGRAMLPMRSPFEERQANLQQREDEWAASERAAKRRRVAEAGQTWDNVKEARTPVPKERMAPRRTPGELIDLVSEAEDLEPQSDITLPNTPPGFVRRPKRRPVASPRQKHETPPPLSSPPVSTTNRVTHVQEDAELLEKAVEDAESQEVEEEAAPKRSKKLRLATGSRPKMLLFQESGLPRRTEKPSRPGLPDRRFDDVAGRVSTKSRVSAALDRDYDGSGKAKRPSEIRKLRNDLTQSSPSDQHNMSDEVVPLPNHEDENHPRREAGPESGLSTRPSPPEKGFPGGCEDTNPVNEAPKTKTAVKAVNPNLQIQPVPPQKNPPSPRQFRRIQSENIRSSRKQPAKPEAREQLALPIAEASKERQVANMPRRLLQRSTSLNMQANLVRERESREPTPPSPVVDTDVGPWSTEAMDLFDWRPPGYVFRGQGKGFGPPETEEANGIAPT